MQLDGDFIDEQHQGWYIAPIRQGVRKTGFSLLDEPSKEFQDWIQGLAGKVVAVRTPYCQATSSLAAAWTVVLAFEQEADMVQYQLCWPNPEMRKVYLTWKILDVDTCW